MKWLYGKPWNQLSREEVEAELRHLLTNCVDTPEFAANCGKRFPGYYGDHIVWSSTVRKVGITLNKGNADEQIYNVEAHF